MFVLAIVLAVATFIENDFGAASAYDVFYNSIWFELLFLLLAVNLIGQIFIFNLYRKQKLTIMLFHLAFILMIVGAAITRYIGIEGTLHLREGEQKTVFQTRDKFISSEIIDRQGALVAAAHKKFAVTPLSIDSYNEDIQTSSGLVRVELTKFIPNAMEQVVESPDGQPTISLIISRQMVGKESVVLTRGDVYDVKGLVLGFDTEKPHDISFTFKSDSFFMRAPKPLSEMSMMSKVATIHPENTWVPFSPMKLYSISGITVVAQTMLPSAVTIPTSVDHQMHQTGRSAMEFEITGSGVRTKAYLWTNNQSENTSAMLSMGANYLRITYGTRGVKIPFAVHLNDFVLERYPGSNSPSSYRSNVTVIDTDGAKEFPFSIYMNNILKHKGFRFYQMSYDQDEMGTVLSVSHDRAGMLVTYIGYALLFLFMFLSIFNPKSALWQVSPSYWISLARKGVGVFVLMLTLGLGTAFASPSVTPLNQKLADEFGKVLVQDQKGRTKPFYTLSHDIVRKITRKNEFMGLSSMQVFLGIYSDFENWKNVPMIKVSNAELARVLGISGNYAAFANIVDMNSPMGGYKLSRLVQEAYAKPESQRTKFDKEVIKVDERINILYMVYSGDFMKVFPIKDDPLHKWGTPDEALPFAVNSDDSLYLKNVLSLIMSGIKNPNARAIETHEYIESLAAYQKSHVTYQLQSDNRVKAEIFYYKAKIFERLFPFYAVVGLVMIFTLVFAIVSGKSNVTAIMKIFTYVLAVGFALHTLALAVRWYVSGHAPMSNGYESMIFISWVTLLAGFIFSRKSKFALSATAVLGSLTLMVAHLSFMDPEITSLVPVLKSYWLTIHVSVITASYGFFGLSAILGLLVMILYSLAGKRNLGRVNTTVDELTVISYQSLTLGLYFLTIGTFLGAIWANESWGRYWGWDPKETWSLITMIVYTFVVHSRMIKSVKGIFTFNVMGLFSFSSVLMTYFGVNYYLSGLHSYAGGDPVPVPTFVYVSVVALVSITIFAYRNYKKLHS